MNKRTILAGKIAGNMNKRTILAGNVAGNMNKRTPQKLPATLMDTMRSIPHGSIQWRSSSGSLRQSPLVYVAGNIS